MRLQTRDENNQAIYTNKATLADRIVTKIESYFPSTCHECSGEYQVKHSDEQSQRLQFCLQPSHDCEAITQDTQATEPSSNSPKGRVWLCSGCYDKNNPLASNRRNRSNSVLFETTTTPLNTPGASPAPSTTPTPAPSQSDIETPDIDDLQNNPDSQPPNRHTSSGDDSQDTEICPRFARNQCPHGMGENKEINGQKCPFSHPRRCKRVCTFVLRGRGGCYRGNDCVLHHPKLCNNSLRNSTCFNGNCTFVHLKGTKRSRPSRDHSHDRDPHHHSSRDRNPRACYTSQSRAEHPRRDPRPHSGHPHQ